MSGKRRASVNASQMMKSKKKKVLRKKALNSSDSDSDFSKEVKWGMDPLQAVVLLQKVRTGINHLPSS